MGGIDITKLDRVKNRRACIVARCPACAEDGGDKKGEHLYIDQQNRFSCVVYPGVAGKEHRRRIFELVGNKDIKRKLVPVKRSPMLVRKINDQLPKIIKSDILGRLGRIDSIPVECCKTSINVSNQLSEEINQSVPTAPERGDVVYTLDEIRLLMDVGEPDLSKIHNIKAIFNGTIVAVNDENPRENMNRQEVFNKNMCSNIEFNDDFRYALNHIESDSGNLFITGRAGTGKSTLLQYFRDNTKKNVAVIAPTGVAALNVKGQTIHSFFQFQPNITREQVHEIRLSNNKKAMFRNLDIIIIDEISMVRADLFDCINEFLKIHGKKPGAVFGGIRMIFFGDLFQLPPVLKNDDREAFKKAYDGPYFFDANVFRHISMEVIELCKIYRQKDTDFIGLLNQIRNNTITQEGLSSINERYDPLFDPPEKDFYIHLTTTNALADNINWERLAKLVTQSHQFIGRLEGQFSYDNLPTDLELELKEGSQVMFVNNDSGGRWVNGSIGKITSIYEKEGRKIIKVKMSTGEDVYVDEYTWQTFKYFFNEEKRELDSESTGSFIQYPLKLAWAVTIHKSQGKTFSKSIIDIGWGTFCHGQLYVALSRSTSLQGIVLKRKILKEHIIVDGRIVDFMNKCVNNRGGHQ